MVNPIPAEHIADAHKLTADGALDLFELTPAGSGATLRFKQDNDVTWRSNLYHGLPMQFTTDGSSTDKAADLPKLVIGQANIDLSLFKPLIYDGSLDGCVVVRYHLLLTNLLNNSSIYELYTYRGKQVQSYNRSVVTLQLASLSDSLNFSLPYRQYLPPDFPAVNI
jgi:phage-related protein